MPIPSTFDLKMGLCQDRDTFQSFRTSSSNTIKGDASNDAVAQCASLLLFFLSCLKSSYYFCYKSRRFFSTSMSPYSYFWLTLLEPYFNGFSYEKKNVI